jgi:hypothetical protein
MECFGLLETILFKIPATAALEILQGLFGDLLVPIAVQDLAVFVYNESKVKVKAKVAVGGGAGAGGQHGLDPGAKILLRLGLYRLLQRFSGATTSTNTSSRTSSRTATRSIRFEF